MKVRRRSTSSPSPSRPWPRRRIGALIAIERKDSLTAWADTGIPLDAQFSYDLMLNIFIPGTPLHDGAVVLRGDEIVAASCFLPLTTRHRLSSELGTRHRAAIGLTEESDALVIVVSEETGTLSLAVEEQLLRPLDETTLRNALAEHAYELGDRTTGSTDVAPTATRCISSSPWWRPSCYGTASPARRTRTFRSAESRPP